MGTLPQTRVWEEITRKKGASTYLLSFLQDNVRSVFSDGFIVVDQSLFRVVLLSISLAYSGQGPGTVGGGQPNSTQFMPMPILRFECGIGINWHKLAHFF